MYQVLYRKWRPKVFADVVGQSHVTETLRNEIKSGRIAHAYLFTGSRGTGKTTCAKIFSRAVNCLHPDDGNPCGKCEICSGIDNESIMDVDELDAASNRKIEDIRDLLEKVRFTPAQAKYRVFIVDEVHMLTTEAFNALLKTLEEPPPYVIFILATTEPHKLPATILSRCQRFDFHRIQPKTIAERLKYIASHENGSISDDAALMIARLSDGAMRDAISMLDQALGRSADVDVSVVCDTAGIAGSEYISRITDSVAERNAAELMRIVSELYEGSKEMLRLCDELIGHFRDIMILCNVQNPENLIVASDAELNALKESAGRFAPARTIKILDVLQESYEKMLHGANRRIEMETALLKLCNIEDSPRVSDSGGAKAETHRSQSSDIQPLLRRVEDLERKLAVMSLNTPSSIPILGATSEPAEKREASSSSARDKGGTAPKESLAVSSKRLSADAKPFAQWGEALELLKSVNQPAYSVLSGSNAFVSGKYMLIQTNGFGRDMLRNSQVKGYIKAILRKITGSDFLLGPYNSSEENNNKTQESDDSVSAAEAIKKRAAEAGIKVEENQEG